MTADVEAIIDVMSDLAALPIPAEFRPGVARQLRLTLDLAAPLLRFDLPDEVPSAPVFRP